VLGSGKVLIAGGSTNMGYEKTAELYDPATNTWSTAASMATARYSPTATVLDSGRVLVAGGEAGEPLVTATVELYVPATNIWSAAASMAIARSTHTSTLLGNGKVLVTGGAYETIGDDATAELYDVGGGGCPVEPVSTCFLAAKSILKVKSNTDPAKRKFGWKWNKGVPALGQGDFGDPMNASTLYELCIYDQSGGTPVLKMGASVAPDGLCGGNPCWSALGNSGWRYKNGVGNGNGITKASLKAGASGKSKVQVKGAGAFLPLPVPISGTEFFDQDTQVVVQLHSSSPVNCWSSTFGPASTKKNDGVQFKAVTP
jgi:hypothetical protein